MLKQPAAPTPVLLVYGTRPEAIKVAPVAVALRRQPDRFHLIVCAMAQHRALIDQLDPVFALDPDFDLDLMRPDQGLNELMSRAVATLDEVLVKVRPEWVLVQGDTTSAMAGALAGFHRRIRVGHIEAGLRTGDLSQPFPEEANRRIIDLVAAAHFAPTPLSRHRLLAEGVDAASIHLTGNTVVDALHMLQQRQDDEEGEADREGEEILVTVHRRENHGEPLQRIFAALQTLARRYPRVRWIYPVHPNPNVGGPARDALSALPNVELHPPFPYPRLIRHLARCRFVLTDSGGLQEEAPTFGKPVLVLRETTERPEGVQAGGARLVGTQTADIVAAASRLLDDRAHFDAMSKVANPYGDGVAAERIAAVLAGEPFQPFDPSAQDRS